jgi:hypothetical protein
MPGRPPRYIILNFFSSFRYSLEKGKSSPCHSDVLSTGTTYRKKATAVKPENKGIPFHFSENHQIPA